MTSEEITTGENRDKQGRFIKGVSANPNGRPVETTEQKLIKKATKELIEEYTTKLAEALPSISPVLIEKATGGDMSAIRELHDRVMGKPPQDITSKGDRLIPKPIYGGLSRHEGNQKDIPTKEAN